MPQYSYECEKDGIFELSLPLRKWDEYKPCPKCRKICRQVVLPSRGDSHFEVPIVVHVGADGKFRFPGSRESKVPKGFESVELRSVREVEQFERKVNAQLQSEARDHQEREEKHFSEIYARNRSELRQQMQHFSPLGREFAETAIRINNARKRKTTDCGFHVEILHEDASKNPQIDESTGWKRKYF